MQTLPPPDVTRGSTRAVDFVLEASKAYTVDWQSARTRLNDEVDRQLSVANKVEGPGDSGGGRVAAVARVGAVGAVRVMDAAEMGGVLVRVRGPVRGLLP